MSSPKRPEWEVRVYGQQLAKIDADLMAQIVVILSREMMTEACEDQKGEANESDHT